MANSNDDGILVLLAKGLRDLRQKVALLARLPGPQQHAPWPEMMPQAQIP